MTYDHNFSQSTKKRIVVLDLLRQKSDLQAFHRRPASTGFPMDKKKSTVYAEDTRKF